MIERPHLAEINRSLEHNSGAVPPNNGLQEGLKPDVR